MAMKVSSRTVCAMPSDIFLFLVTGISCREKITWLHRGTQPEKHFRWDRAGYFYWIQEWDRGGISTEYGGGTEGAFLLNTGVGQRGYFHWIQGWDRGGTSIEYGGGQRGYFHWIWGWDRGGISIEYGHVFSTLLGFNKSTALVSGALTYKTSKVHPWVHQLKMRPK